MRALRRGAFGRRPPASVCLLLALALASAVACNPAATRADRYFVTNLAEKYAQQGDKLMADSRPAEALLAYRQAALADPSYGPGLQRLADAYANQGQRRLAVRLYEQLLAAAPTGDLAKLAHRRAAALYSQLGDKDRATAHLRASLAAGDAGAQQLLDELAALPAPQPLLVPRWRTHIEQPGELLPGDSVAAGLAVAGAALYVTMQEGTLYALDASNGTQRWRFDTGSAGSKRRITSAPVIAGGLVLFGADDNVLRAVSATDGKLAWTFATQAQVFGAPAVDAAAAYVASADGHLYAVSLSDGSLRWDHSIGQPAHASPAVAGAIVYVGAQDNRLHAVAAATGAGLWSFTTSGKVESEPLISGDSIYFGSGDSRLYALDRRSGDEIWYYSTGDAVYAQPLVAGDVVYVASMGQVLAALSVDRGATLWEYYTDTPLRFAPLAAGARLYLAPASDPALYLLDARTGAVLGQQDTGEWPACQPILANGLLYLAQRDGTIIALALPSP
jgi:outer membrane protein assembly factor BamB